MTLVMQPAKESVDSPFCKWPQANLHQGPQKHLPKTQFQHKKDWPVGWQYFGRVGRSVMRFPDAERNIVLLEVGVNQDEFDFWVAGVLLPWSCWWGSLQGWRQ